MSLRNKKLFAGFVGVALVLSVVGVVGVNTADAAALTQSQIDSIIGLLRSFGADQATINNVQTSLSGGTPTTPSTPSTGGTGYVFTRNLKQGDTGADVMQLQKVLNMDAATRVATVGAGSPGNETSSFGPATKAAVIKFQNKYASEVLTPVGLTTGTGFVGAATRAKLSAMSGGVSGGTGTGTGTTPVTPAGTGLSVGDPGQPGASLAPASAARVPFTKVRLTAGNDGDVTINSVTVERTGLAVDTNFSGVVLLDEDGIQIGDAKTFNSNHQANVGTPFTIKAGTSKVVTIAGNMAAAATVSAGQVASLTVVGVNTNGAVVTGSLPLTGAAHTINATLSLGSVTLGTSSYDPNSGVSKEVGTTAYKFTGFRLTAGSTEKVRLWSVRWYQSGSVASGDFANVQTYIDGVAYPVTVSSDGKYYTSTFPGGILMDKGTSKDIWVSGDIVGTSAAGRTIQFDVFKTTDVYLTGETYGYGITPPAGSGSVSTGSRTATTFTISNPWIQSSTVTVTAGSATAITKSSAVQAQNIAVGVQNQVLGGFETDIKGEPISVQQMIFTIATSTVSGSYGSLTNVTIVDQNGAVVAGPVDAVYSSANVDKVTFTDTVTFPVGKKVYTVKGKVATTVSNNTAYTLSSTPSSQWTNVTGLVTGNTITLTNGAFSMNTMTVKSGSLVVTVSPTPAAQTIVAGGTERLFANYQFDASQSGEDLRVSSMKAQLTFGTVDTEMYLSGCRIYDGGTPLNSTVVNPADDTSTSPNEHTFTFDQALVIPKGTVKVLALKCNVSTSAVDGYTYSWGITDTAANLVPTGVVSGSEVTESVTSATGQNMQIGGGSLAVSTDASSPSYALAAAGTAEQVAGIFKFRASNEPVNLTKLGLQLTKTASSSASDLAKVTIWDGGTKVGEAIFTGANTTATSSLSTSLSTSVQMSKDTDKILTVKVDLAEIGSSQAATSSGKWIVLDYLNGEGTGAESGETIYTTGSTAVAGLRMMKSFPTLSQDTLSSSGISDGRLLRFKVTANSKGPVGIAKFEFNVATVTASVTNINLFGYTDSSYSQAISGVSSGGQVQAANYTPSSSSPTFPIYVQTSGSATTTIQVPSGQTYYFELRGSVSGVTTGASVTATLNGDSAYANSYSYQWMWPAYNTVAATTVDSGTSQSFLWSPNSTTSSATSNNDWASGYGVPGLPSSGVIQTRSN